MNESTTPTHGEEWRDMYGPDGMYDPTAHDAVLKQARESIEANRKHDIALQLADGVGRPRAGVAVRATLVRHAFAFGEQTAPLEQFVRYRRMQTDQAAAWQRRFLDVFNAANNLCYWTEREQNDLCKTETHQGQLQLEEFAAIVDWAAAHDLILKGHPLYWSIPKCVPDWVKRYDIDTQWKFAEVRVRNILGRFRGRVKYWDAVNEALWEARLANLPTRHWPQIEPIADVADDIARVLGWCRDEDPDAKYIVNDYGLVGPDQPRGPASDGSMVTATRQRRRMVELMQALMDRNAPPDGLGMQSHTGLVNHDLQWRCYDELSAPGIPLHVTEFWARPEDVDPVGRLDDKQVGQLQAAYVENFLTCAFGHPKMESIFLWGFMNWAIDWHAAGEHTPRPAYETVRRLFRETWHTTVDVTTDEHGMAKFRGFPGRYRIRMGSFETTIDTEQASAGPIPLLV